MSEVCFQGNPVKLKSDEELKGLSLDNLNLITSDLEVLDFSGFPEENFILNIFPSIDTPVCATSVRTFNEKASALANVKVICVSRDLPFALGRFCGAEGLKNIINASDFRDRTLGDKTGLEISEGPLAGLLTRAVLILNKDHKVIYSQVCPEITEEPDYKDVLDNLS